MADWEEIKRLAADFERTQTTETLQRISERNCIDIIKILTEKKLIEVIYTLDGKEFVAPDHLLNEIQNDVIFNGGRMHLHDLASTLNVDYQHVERIAKELERDKPDEYSLILGQLIHSKYKNTLGKQIVDCMLVEGELSIAKFAKRMDLPADFLLTIVNEILPKMMDDYVTGQDGRTFYTSEMMDKYKSIIAGTLTGITRPTSITSIIKRLDIPERIVIPTVEGLLKEGRLDATLESRIFTPSIYSREQNEYINTFYKTNSYISYDVLSRMDIKQPKVFLKKRFPDGIQLKTCLISPDLLSQVESLIEDSIVSNNFIEISTIVPPSLDSDDIELLVQDIYKKNKQFKSSSLIFHKTIVCSLSYITTCKESFKDIMHTKAEDDLKQGKLKEHFMPKEPEPKAMNPDAALASQSTPASGPAESEKQPESVKQAGEVSKQSLADFSDDENSRPAKGRKKERKSAKAAEALEAFQDSDDQQEGKRGKGSRKSGGGTQGREIKQKATKNKYIPGNKGKKNDADKSDEETRPSKQNRSATKQPKAVATAVPETPKKEPLVFMNELEILGKLKSDMRGSEDASEELCHSIAKMIVDELNSNYARLAKQVLDDFLKSQEDSNTTVEVVE